MQRDRLWTLEFICDIKLNLLSPATQYNNGESSESLSINFCLAIELLGIAFNKHKTTIRSFVCS